MEHFVYVQLGEDTCSMSSMEMEENNEGVIGPSDTVSDFLNASRQLVVAVSKTGQKMAHSKQPFLGFLDGFVMLMSWMSG